MASMNKPAADNTNWTTDYTNNWTSVETDLIDMGMATARGDVLAASAASTPVKIPLGQDNQVLTADSAQAAGVAWAQMASAVLLQSSRVSASDAVQPPSTYFSELPGMTLTVTVKSPGKVLILFCAHTQNYNSTLAFRLLRDKSIIRTMFCDPGGNTTHPVSLVTLDTCGIGTFTYHLQWQQIYLFNFNYVWNRELIAITVPG